MSNVPLGLLKFNQSNPWKTQSGFPDGERGGKLLEIKSKKTSGGKHEWQKQSSKAIYSSSSNLEGTYNSTSRLLGISSLVWDAV